MTPGFAALARRWISAFGVVACLAAAMPMPTTAQPAANQSLAADTDRVSVLLRDGRNVDAIDLTKQIATAAPPSERQIIYQWAGWIAGSRWISTALKTFSQSPPPISEHS